MKQLFLAIVLVVGVKMGLGVLDPKTPKLDSYLAVASPAPVAKVEQAQIPSYCNDFQDVCASLSRAGFQGDSIHMALAIGRAESGLRFVDGDQSLANSKWGNSYGPWQIRSLKAESGTGRCRDYQELTKNSMDFHARCAYEISAGGTNWKPWSVYLSGAYKKHL